MATCVCEICGKEFVKTKNCRNRSEADNFEQWAKDNCTECPDCYAERVKKERADNAAELVKEFGWQEEIQGVSDKQIAYAKNLRDKYITENAAKIRTVIEGLNTLSKEKMEEFAKKRGITVEKGIENTYRAYYVVEAYTLKAENKANVIIDLLKNK